MSRDERDPDESVEMHRREVEESLAAVRASIGRELGVVPKARYTLVALIAGAVGLALAVKRRKKKRRG